jgi:hypothetical protein
MKKIFSTLLVAALMLLGTNAFAQATINAGYLNSTQTFENSKGVNANGAFFGLSYNIGFGGGLGISPGLYYSLIANKNASGAKILGVDVSSSSKFSEHAINLPVYLNWGAELSRDSRLFVFGGPTVQYGLSSKTKITGGVGSWSADTTIDNYKDDNRNPLNVYLGGGVGMNAGSIQVTAGFDYGMMNIYKGDNATKSNRYNIKIGIGFAF